MNERDNLALCAMQVLLKESCQTYITLWNRIKRTLGFDYYTQSTTIHARKIAGLSYMIADAMIEASKEEE